MVSLKMLPEISRESGVSVHNLRFVIRTGVVPMPYKDSTGRYWLNEAEAAHIVAVCRTGKRGVEYARPFAK